MVAGQLVPHIVANYEQVSGVKVDSDQKHIEQTPTHQKAFLDDVKKLTNTLEEMGNPFQEDNGDLLSLDTKDIASPHNAERIATHFPSGTTSFEVHLRILMQDDTSSFKENNVELL